MHGRLALRTMIGSAAEEDATSDETRMGADDDVGVLMW
jgi:hypothetical protein